MTAVCECPRSKRKPAGSLAGAFAAHAHAHAKPAPERAASATVGACRQNTNRTNCVTPLHDVPVFDFHLADSFQITPETMAPAAAIAAAADEEAPVAVASMKKQRGQPSRLRHHHSEPTPSVRAFRPIPPLCVADTGAVEDHTRPDTEELEDGEDCMPRIKRSMSDSGVTMSRFHQRKLRYKLPILEEEHGSQARISPTTLRDLIEGKYNDLFHRFIIIDCRFDYEFTGGHIKGAFCFNNEAQVEELYRLNANTDQAVAVVFHCEYSQKRGPTLADKFRDLDRKAHADVHPHTHLTFNDLYVLHKGYRQFFAEYPQLCDPQAYVQMSSVEHMQPVVANHKRAHRRSKSVLGLN